MHLATLKPQHPRWAFVSGALDAAEPQLTLLSPEDVEGLDLENLANADVA
jgi:hypothetical protein